MTLNVYFTLNFVFAQVRPASWTATFEKKITREEDRPTVTAVRMFSRKSMVPDNIKITRIFTRVPWTGASNENLAFEIQYNTIQYI